MIRVPALPAVRISEPIQMPLRTSACLCQFLMVVLATTVTMNSVVAQKPPSVGYVYPPVVRAGETAAVDLGGYDFTIDMQWFVHDERVQLRHEGPPGEYLIPPPPFWFGPRTSLPAMPIPREVAGTITARIEYSPAARPFSDTSPVVPDDVANSVVPAAL